MSSQAGPSGNAFERAVAALRKLGLTEYQSRVYAGLSRIRRGTAREVADASDVPRARVYDILNVLHTRGLVDVQQSTPREYLAVPVDTAIDLLNADHRKRERAARDALASIDPEDAAPVTEQSGVWVVTDRARVSELERQFIEVATRQVVFGLANAEVFDEGTAAALEAASDDVEVIIETGSETVANRFVVAQGVEVMTPARAWEDTPELEGNVGRILVADDRYVLVSTVEDGTASQQTPEEAAVWTSGGGAGDGLVITLRAFMRERVADRIRRESETSD
jgi:sugar-specific transcriptional regulator TrmB